METQSSETPRSEAAPTNGTRRRRTGKKRLKFAPPQNFPRGVRELWTQASREEQERAHRSCTQILAMWLGRRQREEVSKELSIPPLRVWQLSQQALAGMLSGLLHQPRPRRQSQETTMNSKDDDARELKRRNLELEQKLADRDALIQLLTSMPKPTVEPSVSASEAPTSATKTRTRRTGTKAEAGGGQISAQSSAETR